MGKMRELMNVIVLSLLLRFICIIIQDNFLFFQRRGILWGDEFGFYHKFFCIIKTFLEIYLFYRFLRIFVPADSTKSLTNSLNIWECYESNKFRKYTRECPLCLCTYPQKKSVTDLKENV